MVFSVGRAFQKVSTNMKIIPELVSDIDGFPELCFALCICWLHVWFWCWVFFMFGGSLICLFACVVFVWFGCFFF